MTPNNLPNSSIQSVNTCIIYREKGYVILRTVAVAITVADSV